MHDATLKRTTDVADKFPGRESEPASNFNISQIRSLNAGSWFLKVSNAVSIQKTVSHTV